MASKIQLAKYEDVSAVNTSLNNHTGNKSNPHSVTKAQVGLGNVTNVATESTITSGSTKNITSGAVYTHTSNKSNPHGVTKSQVGLGNVLNVASYSKTESDSRYLQPDDNGNLNIPSLCSENIDNLYMITTSSGYGFYCKTNADADNYINHYAFTYDGTPTIGTATNKLKINAQNEWCYNDTELTLEFPVMGDINIKFPSTSGTIALTSDIITQQKYTISVNGTTLNIKENY